MEVILLEKVHKLGELGDKVNVKPGFGRNYLIPQKKAVPATPENVKQFEERRAELEKAQAEALAAAQARAESLQGLEVTIASLAGPEGKLFGSVGTADIAEAISATGTTVERREVQLDAGALRAIGEYDIDLHLHPDVSVTVKVRIVAEETA
ncbi:MAG: 50S ribosomal protein L9 [Gammaproteobacteria bacterium]|nr:MAG: 50S ribosomal protein L9 [Gammaproteobacteria bacterium]